MHPDIIDVSQKAEPTTPEITTGESGELLLATGNPLSE
jgi:hypothetical protein